MVTMENVLRGKSTPSAKVSETERGSVVAETATSTEGNANKLEPEVVRMLVGLAVATGVIGALVLLS